MIPSLHQVTHSYPSGSVRVRLAWSDVSTHKMVHQFLGKKLVLSNGYDILVVSVGSCCFEKFDDVWYIQDLKTKDMQNTVPKYTFLDDTYSILHLQIPTVSSSMDFERQPYGDDPLRHVFRAASLVWTAAKRVAGRTRLAYKMLRRSWQFRQWTGHLLTGVC